MLESSDFNMSYTQKAKEASIKSNAKNQKRIPLNMKRTEYEHLKEYCAGKDIAINTFIKQAISEKMQREP